MFSKNNIFIAFIQIIILRSMMKTVFNLKKCVQKLYAIIRKNKAKIQKTLRTHKYTNTKITVPY